MEPIDLLLVDDRPDNLLALEAVLREERFRLARASSGSEALKAVSEREFAVILLDVQMPGMDGFETARRIREDQRHRHTPIIFITAINKDPVHVFRGYDSGAIDYLTKPFDDFVLRSKVKVIADLYEKNRQIRQHQEKLTQMNLELQREIREREQVEAELRVAHKELEQRVRDRTAALTASNDTLQTEIAERKHAEEQLQRSLAEKEILLKEVHHRVKNNLQVISSLLSLQAFEIQDPKVRTLFQDSQARIHSMALVHESLYESGNLGKIDMESYVRHLLESLLHTHALPTQDIDVRINIEECFFGVDTAIPCGLILNELITNALKHAFPAGQGVLKISLRPSTEDKFTLVVEDNGVGLPEGFKLGQKNSLGLSIVQALVQQLRGAMELTHQEGTRFVMSFPLVPERQLRVSKVA